MLNAERIIPSALLALTSLLLIGCASGPKIYTNSNPDADLRAYQTFGFTQPLGTDRPGGAQSLLSTHLKSATRAEMEKRGYRYSDSNPDLQVNFYVSTKEKIQTTQTPQPSMGMGMGYYGYRGGYYSAWGGYTTEVRQYTEGTLNVDVVDNARDVLVWEGVAVGRIREDAMKNIEARAPVVMAEIFAEYPVPASAM